MKFVNYALIIFSILTISLVLSHTSNVYASSSSTVYANEQSKITLNGLESSDPDGDVLTYSWQQTGGDPVQLSDTKNPVISFMTPAVPADQIKVITLSLTVNDGHGAYDQSTINVNVRHVNQLPIVTGESITVYEGQQVTITGNATDPDNDQLTYRMGQYSGPTVALSSYSGNTASFTAPIISPQASEKLLFVLEANDGQGGIGRGLIEVTVLSHSQEATSFSCPTINAHYGDAVTLTPTITNPSNGQLPYYTWIQMYGARVTLSGSPNPSFTVPTIFDDDTTDMNNNPNTMTFMLLVNDGSTMLPKCESTINISPVNSTKGQPPIANAGQDETVLGGTQVTLDGTGSTGDNIAYSWTQTGGESVALAAPHTPYPSFTAPSVAIGQSEQLTFQLTVSNQYGQSSASVTITVINPNLSPTAKITVQ